MILLALSGPAGAGKTTVAELLVKHCGFTRISFAAPLYDMLDAGGFGRPKTLEEKQALIPGLDLTWRHAAQTLGTEWGRRCLGEHIWTKLALRKCSDPNGRYVIDDCRFENEATAVRKVGGTVVHLRGRAAKIGAGSNHESEKGVAQHWEDCVLDNSSNLVYLEGQIKAILHGVVQG